MEFILNTISPSLWVYAFMISVCAGLVKGIVGFALPMVFISGLSLILPPEIALAGLILPTLVTNGVQALAQGPKAALLSTRQFSVFLASGLIFLLASAQLVLQIPREVFLGGIGIMVVSFSLLQLSGYRFQVRRENKVVAFLVGSVTGFVGGLSGVWGPPTVAYLTAMNTKKRRSTAGTGRGLRSGGGRAFICTHRVWHSNLVNTTVICGSGSACYGRSLDWAPLSKAH